AESSAFIGMGSTGTGNSNTVNFTGTGNLTLTGGGATNAGAAIGAGRNQANATSNISVSAANITLNDGTGENARIGHSGSNNGPGNILVNATGNLALNGANGLGSNVRTTDNVTLHANAISEAAASKIIANALTVTANAGINLAGAGNSVNTFNAANTFGGNVNLTNTAPTLTISGISGGDGSVSVSN